MKRLFAVLLALALLGVVFNINAICGCYTAIKAESLNGQDPILYVLMDKNGFYKPWRYWNVFTPVSEGDQIFVNYPTGSASSQPGGGVTMGYTTCPPGGPFPTLTYSALPAGAYQGIWIVHVDCLHSQFSLNLVSYYPQQ